MRGAGVGHYLHWEEDFRQKVAILDEFAVRFSGGSGHRGSVRHWLAVPFGGGQRVIAPLLDHVEEEDEAVHLLVVGERCRQVIDLLHFDADAAKVANQEREEAGIRLEFEPSIGEQPQRAQWIVGIEVRVVEIVRRRRRVVHRPCRPATGHGGAMLGGNGRRVK